VFVDHVYRIAAFEGYRVENVDVTVLAERPKLKPFKQQMVQSLAGLLRVPADRVNIKAGTNEGCDAIGRGEAIAAHAVVLLQADF
jgi:2-C-methyl-D-erythritol 2,4-cyclodiphosphate synthase